MVVNLLILAVFAEVEMIEKTEYLEELDRQFLENSDDDLLLALEVLHDNTYEAIKSMNHYKQGVNDYVLAKMLLGEISAVYWSNRFSIEEFGQKIYLIWDWYFPESMKYEEPFYTLCYADDCSSYGDENQTREMYEEAFSSCENGK